MRKIFFRYIIAIFVFFGFGNFVFAELHPTRRVFELGIDAGAGASNSALKLQDFFKKELVIDLKQIVSDIPNKNLNINSNFDAGFFMNLNLRKVRVGLYANVEGNIHTNLPKSIFEFLVEQNGLVNNKEFKYSYWGDIYANVGLGVHTKFSGWGLTINPAIYVPIAYIPESNETMTINSYGDNGVKAQIKAETEVYTGFSLDKDKSKSMMEQVSDMTKNFGFELGFGLEKRIFTWFDLGGAISVPITPGKLPYKMKSTFMYEVYYNNLLGAMTDADDVEHGTNNESSSSYEDVSHEVYKPLRMNVEAAFRPFGEWFTASALVGLCIRDPYSNEKRMIFPEYNFGVEVKAKNYVGLRISTEYKGKIFRQCAALMLNVRALEINIKAMMQGADFSRSWGITGLGACLGVRIGW